jgi:hypothetical protein
LLKQQILTAAFLKLIMMYRQKQITSLQRMAPAVFLKAAVAGKMVSITACIIRRRQVP